MTTQTVDKDAMPPTAEALIGLLDSEIEAIRDESSSRGWNSYAILAALLAIVWLLLDQVEKGGYSAPATLAAFVGLFLIVDACKFMRPRSTTDQSRSRYRLSHASIRGSAIVIHAELLSYISVAVLAVVTHELVNWVSYISAVVLCTALVFAALGALLVSSRPVPVSDSPPRLAELALSAIVVLALIGGAGYFRGSLHDPETRIQNVRLAGLMVVAVNLVLILVRDVSRPPLLATLVALRRELSLGTLTPAAAAPQIEMALLGMKAGDLVQEHVRRFLELLGRLNAEALQAEACLTTAVEQVTADPDARAEVMAHMDATMAHVDRMEELATAAASESHTISNKLQFLRFASATGKEDAQRVMDQLEDARAATLERSRAIKAKSQELLKVAVPSYSHS